MTSKPTPPMMQPDPSDFLSPPASPSASAAFLILVEAALCGDLDCILDNMQDAAARQRIQGEMDAVLDIFFAGRPSSDAVCACVPPDYADVLNAAVREQAYSDMLLAHIGAARRIKVNRRKRSVADFAYNFGQSQE